MTVNLSPHGEELLKAAQDRGVRCLPEEVVERALEAVARSLRVPFDGALEKRSQAVRMQAFHEEHRLSFDDQVTLLFGLS
ncbi:MAG: hypothetical protein ABSH50_15600 [Bryobacteraceae bacterium]